MIPIVPFRQRRGLPASVRQLFAFLAFAIAAGAPNSSSALSSFAYAYNSANQRTRVTNSDNSYWSYQYDTLGQVISGKHHWADGTRVAGQQFEFGFDDIGNRQSAIHGGNASGSNLRVETYTANSVNQYIQRTIPGFAELQGQARADATVTVNVQPTEQYGPYWRYEHAVNNSTGAVQQTLGIVGVLQGAGPNGTDVVATNATSIFLPQTPETFTHDADGNLLRDGRWNYSWDAENRLTSFTSLTNLPAVSRKKVDCTYDPHYRRTKTISSIWNGYAYAPQSTNHFVYDGWNLVAQFDGNGQLEKSFLWGTDLSGTPQGAGGVGGLTAMTLHQGAYAGTYLYCYDGRGNVAALVSATTGEEMARYEYGPFGELLRASGPLAFLNPLRFSTKFCDDETGFYYYGYRYYDPSVGRWLSRDPLQERGGRNLYGFVGNDPANAFDPNGLYNSAGHFYTTYLVARAAGFDDDAAYELAYWSQYPDQNRNFNATKTTSSVADVRNYLHSLTGDEASKRRSLLNCLLRSGKFDSASDRGILVHALGDAYAHAYVDTIHSYPSTKGNPPVPNPNYGKELLYGDGIGHLLNGHFPDFIGYDPGKYGNYVNSLYEFLSSQGGRTAGQNPQWITALKTTANGFKGPRFLDFFSEKALNAQEVAAISGLAGGFGGSAHWGEFNPDSGPRVVPQWGLTIDDRGSILDRIKAAAANCCGGR